LLVILRALILAWRPLTAYGLKRPVEDDGPYSRQSDRHGDKSLQLGHEPITEECSRFTIGTPTGQENHYDRYRE
jgi:hypothetical protein